MPKGSGYGSMRAGANVASTLKRKAAGKVSYQFSKDRFRPRSEGGTGKLGTVAKRPKVTP